MYWSAKYSNFLYWTLPIKKWWEILEDIKTIKFNSYDFSDIIISNIPNTYDDNSIDIESYQLTSHWLGLSNWLIKDKTLTISWRILAENANLLEKKIKKIKSNLMKWEWTLYINTEDWILQTKAIVSKLSLPRNSRTINSIQITINFKILDPFFYSLKINEISYYDISNKFTATIRYLNWTHSTKPSIFILFKDTENIDEVNISINNKLLSIKEKINSWDSLSINSEKLDVAKNWKYWRDWLGEFWELENWENKIEIDANWEYQAEVFIKYRDTFI